MEIDTKGKFNMWGEFSTYDGIYILKIFGVIDKKFNLKPGWNNYLGRKSNRCKK